MDKHGKMVVMVGSGDVHRLAANGMGCLGESRCSGVRWLCKTDGWWWRSKSLGVGVGVLGVKCVVGLSVEMDVGVVWQKFNGTEGSWCSSVGQYGKCGC